MITPEQFRTLFPEFGCVENDRIQIFIDQAVVVLNETYWGVKYNMGLYYYTAHRLSMAAKTANSSPGKLAESGPIGMRTVDGVSVSYASNFGTMNTDEAFYNLTIYGQQYLQLRETLGVSAFVI